MNRREFMAELGALVVAQPAGALAQTGEQARRVAIVLTTAPASGMTGPDPINPNVRAFVHGMRAMGYVEGRNLVLERMSAEGRFDQMGEIVKELVARKCEVIVSAGNELALQAKHIASETQIVIVNSSDPVTAGVVASLAHPGGNVTGLTGNTGPEFEAKRLQLLKDILPDASRVAFLGTAADWVSDEGTSVRAAGRMLGIALVHAEHTPTHFADAFLLMSRDRPHAIFVARRPGTFANRKVIVDFSTVHRVPGFYPYREFVDVGGLMSYGASLPDLYRRAAGHVDKILKGAKPGDIPVEQPTIFELVVNLKTAKALGIVVPPAILIQADEVIE